MIIAVLAAGYFGVKGVIRYVNDYNDKVNKVIEEAESDAATVQDNTEPVIEEDTAGGIAYNEGYTSPVEADPLNELIESLLGNMTTEEMIAGDVYRIAGGDHRCRHSSAGRRGDEDRDHTESCRRACVRAKEL